MTCNFPNSIKMQKSKLKRDFTVFVMHELWLVETPWLNNVPQTLLCVILPVCVCVCMYQCYVKRHNSAVLSYYQSITFLTVIPFNFQHAAHKLYLILSLNQIVDIRFSWFCCFNSWSLSDTVPPPFPSDSTSQQINIKYSCDNFNPTHVVSSTA